MQNPVAQAEFDAITREGKEIVIRVSIGDQHDIPAIPPDSRPPDVGFYVDVEPLMERRRQGGNDTLTAMCFCIELVRKAFKTFVANGGSVYFRGSRSPIDLQSPWFESLGLLLKQDYLLPDSHAAEDGG